MGNLFSSDKKIIQPKILGNNLKPWDLSTIKPELLVYRQNRNYIVISHEMDEKMATNSMISSDLLPSKRIIFITHGFRTTKNKNWLHIMKDLMIAERDQTVVIVGWGNGADVEDILYEQSIRNSLFVSQWLTKYAIEIRKRFEDIYIWGIGHSLGAHLMGTAGRVSNVFDRVTGLDPSGPGFQVENEDKRLSRNDADLVDVIHSDGKSVPYFGTLLPLGSIDFYPNYGWNQTTYDESSKKPYMIATEDEPKGEISPYGDGFTISHTRAIDYFIWSVANKGKFRTNLVLESNPSVETAVHRLKSVNHFKEMGYYADECCGPENNTLVHKVEPVDTCYYVVTNAREPWL